MAAPARYRASAPKSESCISHQTKTNILLGAFLISMIGLIGMNIAGATGCFKPLNLGIINISILTTMLGLVIANNKRHGAGLSDIVNNPLNILMTALIVTNVVGIFFFSAPVTAWIHNAFPIAAVTFVAGACTYNSCKKDD